MSEDAVVETVETSSEDTGMDMDAAVADIASGLGFEESNESTESTDTPDEELPIDEPTSDEPVIEAAPVVERAQPSSWAKETADIWKALPDAAKDQIEKREKQMLEGIEQYKEHSAMGKSLKEVINPYMPMLNSRGLDPAKAVSALLNAQHQLDQNPTAGLLHIAKSYNIDIARLAEAAGAQTQVSPEVQALRNELNGIKSTLTSRQNMEYEQTRATVASEVSAFAADPNHPYFDEVADDIVAMLKAGETLDKAYEKAVWANPVTRAKELAKTQTESQAKLREKAKADAAKARAASSTNMRTRDTNNAPTELPGKLFSEDHDNEMRDIIRKGKERAH